jgi:hypothetical protein
MQEAKKRFSLKMSPLVWMMLIIGIIFLIYAPLYKPDPTRDQFGAPEGLLQSNPGSRVAIVMFVTGAALFIGAWALALLKEDDKIPLAVLFAVGLAIRLAFAFGFFGSADVNTYYEWCGYISEGGNIYRNFEVYHWPPVPIFLMAGMGQLASWTGIPLYGLGALPFILADLVTGGLIYTAAGKEGLPEGRRISLSALYVLNPVSIAVSSLHYQFGSLYMLPVLLAWFVRIYRRKYKWAALWLGGALSISLIPMLFIPAFLAHLKSWRQRVVFLALLGIPPLLVTMPYLIDDFGLVMRGFLNYRSEYGVWGSSYLLDLFTRHVWVGPREGFRGYAIHYGSYGMLLLLIILGFTAFRRMKLSGALSLTMLVFFLNPTGFANQYVILLLPFLIMEFESRAAIWYTILGTAFVLTVYTGHYFIPWIMDLLPTWANATRLFSLPIWVWCLWEVGRRLVLALRLPQPFAKAFDSD